MDMGRNSFFWTWKTGNSSNTNKVANPMWSYSNGLKVGYVPTNPRDSKGACMSIAQAYNQPAPSTIPFVGSFAAAQTGGAGAGGIDPAATAQYAFPPASITSGGPVVNLPTYTPTGKPITLSASAPAATAYPSGASTVSPGNGWFKAADTAGWYQPISGCSYVNPWSGNGAPIPTAPVCGGAGAAAAGAGAAGNKEKREVRKKVMRREAVAAPSVITPAPLVNRS